MNDCIFCKIGYGEVPSEKIYEDENYLAFLDNAPVSKGHTLLIPKKHYRWFYDIPNDEYSSLFLKAKELVPVLKDKYNTEYVKLGIVGTDVPHVHIHLIPRNISKDEPI